MNEHRGEDRPASKMRWEDGAVYALALAGIYLLVGVLFFYAGKEKIIDGSGAPPPIAKQFSGTFLDTIPGIDAAWTILGILESLIFILVLVSLIRLEFMPDRRKSFCSAPSRWRSSPSRSWRWARTWSAKTPASPSYFSTRAQPAS